MLPSPRSERAERRAGVVGTPRPQGGARPVQPRLRSTGGWGRPLSWGVVLVGALLLLGEVTAESREGDELFGGFTLEKGEWWRRHTVENRTEGDCPDTSFQAVTSIVTQEAMTDAPLRYTFYEDKFVEEMEKKHLDDYHESGGHWPVYMYADMYGTQAKFKITPDYENLRITIEATDHLKVVEDFPLEVTIPCHVYTKVCAFDHHLCHTSNICSHSVTGHFHVSTSTNLMPSIDAGALVMVADPTVDVKLEGYTGCSVSKWMNWASKVFSGKSIEQHVKDAIQKAVADSLNKMQKRYTGPDEFKPFDHAYFRLIYDTVTLTPMSTMVMTAHGVMKAEEQTSKQPPVWENRTFCPPQDEINVGPPSNYVPDLDTPYWADESKHDLLLSGVRMSSTIFTGMVWAANTAGALDRDTVSTFQDATFHTHAFIQEPHAGIPENDLFTFFIPKGHLLTQCDCQEEEGLCRGHEQDPLLNVLDVSFEKLQGVGSVRYIKNPTRPGVALHIDRFYEHVFNATVTYPRIPISPELMQVFIKMAANKSTEYLNDFFDGHPFRLPEAWVPLVPSPSMEVVHQVSGTQMDDHGFVEIESHCYSSGGIHQSRAVVVVEEKSVEEGRLVAFAGLMSIGRRLLGLGEPQRGSLVPLGPVSDYPIDVVGTGKSRVELVECTKVIPEPPSSLLRGDWVGELWVGKHLEDDGWNPLWGDRPPAPFQPSLVDRVVSGVIQVGQESWRLATEGIQAQRAPPSLVGSAPNVIQVNWYSGTSHCEVAQTGHLLTLLTLTVPDSSVPFSKCLQGQAGNLPLSYHIDASTGELQVFSDYTCEQFMEIVPRGIYSQEVCYPIDATSSFAITSARSCVGNWPWGDFRTRLQVRNNVIMQTWLGGEPDCPSPSTSYNVSMSLNNFGPVGTCQPTNNDEGTYTVIVVDDQNTGALALYNGCPDHECQLAQCTLVARNLQMDTCTVYPDAGTGFPVFFKLTFNHNLPSCPHWSWGRLFFVVGFWAGTVTAAMLGASAFGKQAWEWSKVGPKRAGIRLKRGAGKSVRAVNKGRKKTVSWVSSMFWRVFGPVLAPTRRRWAKARSLNAERWGKVKTWFRGLRWEFPPKDKFVWLDAVVILMVVVLPNLFWAVLWSGASPPINFLHGGSLEEMRLLKRFLDTTKLDNFLFGWKITGAVVGWVSVLLSLVALVAPLVVRLRAGPRRGILAMLVGLMGAVQLLILFLYPLVGKLSEGIQLVNVDSVDPGVQRNLHFITGGSYSAISLSYIASLYSYTLLGLAAGVVLAGYMGYTFLVFGGKSSGVAIVTGWTPASSLSGQLSAGTTIMLPGALSLPITVGVQVFGASKRYLTLWAISVGTIAMTTCILAFLFRDMMTRKPMRFLAGFVPFAACTFLIWSIHGLLSEMHLRNMSPHPHIGVLLLAGGTAFAVTWLLFRWVQVGATKATAHRQSVFPVTSNSTGLAPKDEKTRGKVMDTLTGRKRRMARASNAIVGGPLNLPKDGRPRTHTQMIRKLDHSRKDLLGDSLFRLGLLILAWTCVISVFHATTRPWDGPKDELSPDWKTAYIAIVGFLALFIVLQVLPRLSDRYVVWILELGHGHVSKGRLMLHWRRLWQVVGLVAFATTLTESLWLHWNENPRQQFTDTLEDLGIHLVWPSGNETGKAAHDMFDDAFQLYGDSQTTQSKLSVVALGLFIIGFIIDGAINHTHRRSLRLLTLVLELTACVFLLWGLLVPALPNYPHACHLDQLVPADCGTQFARIVTMVAGDAVGYMMAVIFAQQMGPLFLFGTVALYRGSYLILMQEDEHGMKENVPPLRITTFIFGALLPPVLLILPILVYHELLGNWYTGILLIMLALAPAVVAATGFAVDVKRDNPDQQVVLGTRASKPDSSVLHQRLRWVTGASFFVYFISVLVAQPIKWSAYPGNLAAFCVSLAFGFLCYNGFRRMKIYKLIYWAWRMMLLAPLGGLALYSLIQKAWMGKLWERMLQGKFNFFHFFDISAEISLSIVVFGDLFLLFHHRISRRWLQEDDRPSTKALLDGDRPASLQAMTGGGEEGSTAKLMKKVLVKFKPTHGDSVIYHDMNAIASQKGSVNSENNSGGSWFGKGKGDVSSTKSKGKKGEEDNRATVPFLFGGGGGGGSSNKSKPSASSNKSTSKSNKSSSSKDTKSSSKASKPKASGKRG